MSAIDWKYQIRAVNLCSGNTHTEEDSVLFLAKDKAFLIGGLPGYRAACVELGANPAHIEAIDLLTERVKRRQEMDCKVPDTDLPCEIERCTKGVGVTGNETRSVEGDAASSSPSEVHLLVSEDAPDFAKLVRASDGRLVLFYVEPFGGEYKLHQLANHDGFQADLAISFTSEDEDKNERLAYGALGVMNRESADKVLQIVSEMMSADAAWVRDNRSVFSSLLLVGQTCEIATEEIIKSWTDDECRAAQDWAIANHLQASDNDDVIVPPIPECVRRMIEEAQA